MRACWAQLSTLLSLSACLAATEYSIKDDYSASTFFDMFDFFDTVDPSQGYVQYVSQSTAQAAGLINSNGSSVYMGVDHVNIASSSGRESVRLTSKASYTHGLIILDLVHMPGGICGAWPAFWTVGPSWPESGEIDIIEGTNNQTGDDMTLHTSAGCSISSWPTDTGGLSIGDDLGSSAFSGLVTTSNCDSTAAEQSSNAGCQISDASVSTSFGAGFNDAGGGAYATEWTSDFIRIFVFPRKSVPHDISSANPDPDQWGTPLAYFSDRACDFDRHFRDHQIVFDTTFCGSWIDRAWNSDPTCSVEAPTCQSYMQNNPEAFKEAYWSVSSLKVYTDEFTNPNQTSSNSSFSKPLVHSVAEVSTLGSSTSGNPFVNSSIAFSNSSSRPWTMTATSAPES